MTELEEKVAYMFVEQFGGEKPCNMNGNDEWLPLVCEYNNNHLDHNDVCEGRCVYKCWVQFVKHWRWRRG